MRTVRVEDLIESFKGEDGKPKFPIMHMHEVEDGRVETTSIVIPKVEVADGITKFQLRTVPYGHKSIMEWAEKFNVSYPEAVREIFTLYTMRVLNEDREATITDAYIGMITELLRISTRDRGVHHILDNIRSSGSAFIVRRYVPQCRIRDNRI